MSTVDTAETEHAAQPEATAPSLIARLKSVTRKALIDEQFGTLGMQSELIVERILAEMCPPNHLLLSAEVTREYDEGINTPDAYEPAYDYAAVETFRVLHDTVEDGHAGMLAFAAEQAEATPDGTGDLDKELAERFRPQQEALIKTAAENPLGLLSRLTASTPRTE